MPALDDGPVRDADAEVVAPAGELVERRGGLRHRGGRPGVDRDDAGAEPDALGGRRVGGQDDERVATGDLGDPRRLEAELLGEPHPLDGLVERATGGDEGADGHEAADTTAGPTVTEART